MFNQMAAGKKVYGNGSYAPNRGHVNPSGYMQRELRKRMTAGPYGGVSKIGKDGQSDTRSGAASRMLKSRLGVKGSSSPSKSGKKPGSPKDYILDPRHPSNDPGHKINVPSFQPIKISSTGQLELPYDMQASAALLARKEADNRDLLALQQQDQQTQMELAQARRNAGLDFTNLQRQTLNNSAGRGTAFSSQYGVGVANNATSYNNLLGDLATQESGWKSTLLNSRNGILNAFNSFLQKEALNRGITAGEKAGKLGYGTSKNHPTSGNKKGQRKNNVKGSASPNKRGKKIPSKYLKHVTPGPR